MPDYGHTGGGLLFYDRETEAADLLTHEDLIPWHFTMSLVALPCGKLLGGTGPPRGPRIFVQVPDGRILVLFRSGIAQLDPETYEVTMVAEAPHSLGNGGAYVDGACTSAVGCTAPTFGIEVPPAQ